MCCHWNSKGQCKNCSCSKAVFNCLPSCKSRCANYGSTTGLGCAASVTIICNSHGVLEASGTSQNGDHPTSTSISTAMEAHSPSPSRYDGPASSETTRNALTIASTSVSCSVTTPPDELCSRNYEQ